MKSNRPFPPTALPLGERFNSGIITAAVAPTITKIETITIGDASANKRDGKSKKHYPYHLVDIWNTGPSGEPSILIRSKELRMNRKQLRTFTRAITRKVATFIFDCKQAA